MIAFFAGSIKGVVIVEFKLHMTSASIHYIIMSKFNYLKERVLIILLEKEKSLEVV